MGKVTSLLFHMLSRFVTVFLLRSKHLLISGLQSMTAVILESKEIKSVVVSIFSPIYLPRSDGTWEDAMEKGMAIHSSILAWRIPWTEKPGRQGCKDSDMTEAT